jgi:hypothetical protein
MTSKSNAEPALADLPGTRDISGLRVGKPLDLEAVVSGIVARSGPENTKAASGSGGFGFKQNAT